MRSGALVDIRYSPACILSFLITAVSRGEFKEAWSWADESPEDKGESRSKGEPSKKFFFVQALIVSAGDSKKEQ